MNTEMINQVIAVEDNRARLRMRVYAVSHDLTESFTVDPANVCFACDKSEHNGCLFQRRPNCQHNLEWEKL